MKIKNYLFLVFFCVTSISFTQDIKDDFKQEKTRKNAIGFSVGLPGYGIEYARSLNDKFNIRIGYTFFNLKDYEINDFKINDDTANLLINANNKAYELLFDYKPFTSSFRLTFGMAYFNNFFVSINSRASDELNIGDITISEEKYGYNQIEADWSSSIAPYIGIGFGRSIPKRNRLGISLDIGAYYLGSPNSSISSTGLLSPSEELNRDTIKEGFDNFKIIPNLKLKLAYSF